MPEPELLPPAQHPLLDVPAEEKLREEVESLRRQLEEARRRNAPEKDHDKNKRPGRPGKRTLWLIALGIVGLLIVAFFVGFLPHYRREKQLKQDAEAEARALPVVTYFYAQRSPAQTQLVLPGNIAALTEAPLLARANGYLKKRYVDIGDRVKAGQLLAEIAAPDLDQQVSQARAQLLQTRAMLKQAASSLEQAKANQALAKVTADRWAALLRRGAVAPQDNDSRQADYQAQTANVAALQEAVGAAQQNVSASEANLNRLLELQGYEQVRAPFAGVITLRNVDEGALIATGQTLLFRIAQTGRLRTYINVPESGAPLVQLRQKAILSLAEYPGRQFVGEITRTSDALDPTTRTLLTEVQVPNPQNTLSPGMFAEVSLDQSRPDPPVMIPADALIVLANGTFAAVLQGDANDANERQPAEQTRDSRADSQGGKKQDGQDNGAQKGPNQKNTKQAGDSQKKEKNDREEKAELLKQQQELPTFTVHLSRVSVGRDYGNAIEILTGLNGGERVVESPNDHVQEKAKVKGQRSKQNPVEASSGSPSKQNANSEKLNPQPNAEPNPKQPAKERTSRGPG